MTNITRQKLKEAYDLHTAAVIERAEKQILLAKNARKLLNLLDDTPIVPGDAHPPFEHSETAREVLNMAEDELRSYEAIHDPIHSSAGALGPNAMPTRQESVLSHGSEGPTFAGSTTHASVPTQQYVEEDFVGPQQVEAPIPSTASVNTEPPYPVHDERVVASSTY